MGFLARFRSSKSGEAASDAPEPDAAMSALAEKMAAKRGDNISHGVASGRDDFGGKLASNARDAGIVSASGEDEAIKPT